MGLGTDWALPSEPSIVQIVSELNTHLPATSQRPASPDQSLSQLPIEKESVGKSILNLLFCSIFIKETDHDFQRSLEF